jgi:hypothetical protein
MPKNKKLNYPNEKSSSPFKKGRIHDIVKPTRPKVHRICRKSTKEVEQYLYQDLVQVLASKGIILSNVYSLATELVQLGWIKQKKIVREMTKII